MKNDTTGYDVSTPELLALFNTMQNNNTLLGDMVAKNMRKDSPLSIRNSNEYKNATISYRAYWNAVDARKNLTSV